MHKEGRPDCNIQGCENCFARDKKGRCVCLNNTEFKNGKCPFYKSQIQHLAQLEILQKKLKGGN